MVEHQTIRQPERYKNTVKRFLSLFLFLLIFLWVLSTHSVGNLQTISPRLWIGLKMFPTIVGSTIHLKEKQTKNSAVLLLIVYRNNETIAKKVASRLRNQVETIHEYPFRLAITNNLSFHAWKTTPVAGLFLAEPLIGPELQRVVQFGITYKVVTFSSFPNDVEQGILAGLYVSSRILPALNSRTAKLSGIKFPSFFKKIAYYHD